MKRVFISYTAKDVQIAKEVYDILRTLGLDVWLDVYEIEPGDDVTRRIEDAIKSCQLFVAIITHNSVNSNWVQKELKIALQRSAAKQDNSTVPIVLDGVEVPEFIKNVEPIILRPYDYQDLLYRDLSKVVERVFRERPYNSDIWSSGNDYVQDISGELSNEFPAKRLYRPISRTYPQYTESINEEDAKIKSARKKLDEAARGYEIKAYIVLAMMIFLLSTAFGLFYYAGDIVSEETKKIVPLIDSTKNKEASAQKNMVSKTP